MRFEVTARAWSVRLVTTALLALPLPVPLPAPGLPVLSPPVVNVAPNLPIAIPSLPVAAPPIVSPAAAPSTTQAGNGSEAGAGAQRGSQGGGAGSSSNNPSGIPIPFTTIYVSSPLDIALLAALAALPLLLGIWLLLFGRTFAEARRRRDAQVRLMLAADLGLRPRDVAAMGVQALFSLREKSAFDELTGAPRRAAGISMAEREIARARRHDTPLTVAFVDVDGLKDANEAGGHAAGDSLLRGLVALLREGLRAEDVVFRYGGDEFVCVLPETSARDARAKLGEIQDAAAKQGLQFCAGLAELRRSDDVVSLFARADGDLYDFKANRRQIVQLPKRSPEPKSEHTDIA